MPDATITSPLWCAAGRPLSPQCFYIGLDEAARQQPAGSQSDAREVMVCVL